MNTAQSSNSKTAPSLTSKFESKIAALAEVVDGCIAQVERVGAHLGVEIIPHSADQKKMIEAIKSSLPAGLEVKDDGAIVKVRRSQMPELWRIVQDGLPQLFDRALSPKMRLEQIQATMKEAAESARIDVPILDGAKVTPARFAELFGQALAYERTRRELTGALNEDVRNLFSTSIAALREGESVCVQALRNNRIPASEREQISDLASVLRERLVGMAKERNSFIKYCEDLKAGGVSDFIEHYLNVRTRVERLAAGPVIFEGLCRNLKKSMSNAPVAQPSSAAESRPGQQAPTPVSVIAPIMPQPTRSVVSHPTYDTKTREAQELQAHQQLLEKRALLRLAPAAVRDSLAQQNSKEQLEWKIAQVCRALSGNAENARLDVLLTNKDVKRELRLIVRACPQLLMHDKVAPEKGAEFVREYCQALKTLKTLVRQQGAQLHEVIREKPELFASLKSIGNAGRVLKGK